MGIEALGWVGGVWRAAQCAAAAPRRARETPELRTAEERSGDLCCWAQR